MLGFIACFCCALNVCVCECFQMCVFIYLFQPILIRQSPESPFQQPLLNNILKSLIIHLISGCPQKGDFLLPSFKILYFLLFYHIFIIEYILGILLNFVKRDFLGKVRQQVQEVKPRHRPLDIRLDMSTSDPA